jgi:hypothetical protein
VFGETDVVPLQDPTATRYSEIAAADAAKAAKVAGYVMYAEDQQMIDLMLRKNEKQREKERAMRRPSTRPPLKWADGA